MDFDWNSNLTIGFTIANNSYNNLYTGYFGLGGYIADSWEDYDVIPFNNNPEIEPSGGDIEIEKFPILDDYIKNNLVILVPKTYLGSDSEDYDIKIGYKNSNNSYSILDENTFINIPSVADNCYFYGYVSFNPEPLSVWFPGNGIVSYDETIPIPEPDQTPGDEEYPPQQEPGEQQEPGGNVESSPIDIIQGRVDHAANRARQHLFSILREDYSDFDVLDDIKIQLPEEQADILLNFRKYIN